MTIDQEVAVRSVFVLADARFRHRCGRERRNPSPQIFAYSFDRLSGNNPLPVIGIELRPMFINRNLQTASFQVGQSVNEVVKIDPRRHPWWFEEIVTRWHTEEENFLSTVLD